MRRPATTAAVTLTAIGIALSAPLPTNAQDTFDQPVDLLGTGSGPDVSIRSTGPDSQAGYFVGPDGSIQYRDTTVDTVTPMAEAVDSMITAPMSADMFDAVPANNDTVTLDTLQDVFGGTMTDDVSIDASAPAGGYYSEPSFGGGAMASDGYTIENGTIVSGSPAFAPVQMEAPMVETHQYTVTTPPVKTMPVLAPLAVTEPFQTETTYAAPVYAEPVIATPVHAPFVTEPMIAAPAPIVDHYASLEPTPLLSGRDFAAQGDGAYGPSTIKRAGDGPAGRDAAVFIAKSTIVELPVDAHEILVADPTRVRAVLRTARQMVLIGLQPGQTNLTAFDETGKQILNLDANVRYDLRPLRRALASTFPGVQVEIESILGEVVLKGRASGVAEGDAIRDLVRRYLYSAMLGAGVEASIDDIEFVDRLSSATDDQILVKVRIAEMRRSVVKQFGVDFNLASDDAISAAAGSIARSVTDFGSTTNAFGVNGAALGGIAANIAGSFESVNFGALVRAFERHNVMRVLAEPTLTAVSGETASFLAGGQFPYPTSVDDGNIGFTFRDFGVALEFTPVVVGDGRISLTVATEISELTTEGALSAGDLSIPGISIRKANTTVELPSGGTMSIAGMLLQRDANAHTGLPGLKNLPVIGQLFSSTDYQKQETELVILVTPYIVKPGQEKDFRLPTDGFAPASDFDMFVLGRLHKVYGAGGPHGSDPHAAGAKAALEAPFGFILE